MLIAAFSILFTLVVVGMLIKGDDDTQLDMCYDPADGERQPHKWGYTDTYFEFDGPRSVRVTGTRYPLAGYSMPYFIPFAEEVLDLPFRPEDIVREVEQLPLPEAKVNTAFLAAAEARFDAGQLSIDPKGRLIHSHGQLSVDEIYRLLYSGALARTVDLVCYPQSEEDVRDLVRLAHEHKVCLVPYGGGTNVSGALACPPQEERMIVSVDMRRMKRILSIDDGNLQACVEAGISGKELERELDAKGYTTGHDPDSVELSTLGGWISTNASGMKKNKYGNIEDIVLEATLVTPTGEVETKHATPRNATGIQPRVFLFGSEGNFGIITKAVIKIHPRPQVRQYGSLVFPSFEKGVAFLKELRQGEGVLPASIRLVNNFEFRFGQALKSAPTFWKGLSRKMQDFVLYQVKGFKPLEMAASTIVMEGTRNEVEYQKKVIFRTAKRFGAISGGASKGKGGYTLTFGIAYIRDFFNQFHVLGETFETSVRWDCILTVCQTVRECLQEECRVHGVAGKSYLSYRVTQTYHTGVCIYFTMGFSGKGLDDPIATYHKIEHTIRQAILDKGGSLSHHHGIGKIRQDFMAQIQSPNSIEVLRQTKKAMDPNNVFGIQNGVFVQSGPAAAKQDEGAGNVAG
jgi:alkyldihydroxyacetonephosphate synthase